MRRLVRRYAADPVARFWAWWESEGRASLTEALAHGEPGGTATALTEAVSALGAGLVWEAGTGEVSAYELVVTAAGDPDHLAAARRWLLAAPASDPVWSFSDHRAPSGDPEDGVLSLGDGPDVDLARVTVSARADGSRFDVLVHHPAFGDLDQDARTRLAHLALDNALGEHDATLWLGQVTASEISVVDGFGLAGLRAVVSDLKSRHLDADGQPGWALLRGEGPDGEVLALAQVPLHPSLAPTLTRHAVVLLPYASSNTAGLPAESSLDALREFEQALLGDLGVDGTLVAHESSAGVRTLHLYLDETTDAESVVRRHTARWGEGRARTTSTSDRSWSGVRHLRG